MEFELNLREVDDWLIGQGDPLLIRDVAQELEAEGMDLIKTGQPYRGELLITESTRLEHAAASLGAVALGNESYPQAA